MNRREESEKPTPVHFGIRSEDLSIEIFRGILTIFSEAALKMHKDMLAHFSIPSEMSTEEGVKAIERYEPMESMVQRFQRDQWTEIRFIDGIIKLRTRHHAPYSNPVIEFEFDPNLAGEGIGNEEKRQEAKTRMDEFRKAVDEYLVQTGLAVPIPS